MKKYNILHWLLFVFIILNVSCKKYLEVKSDDKLVVPSTLEDFQSLMDNANDFNNTTPGMGASAGDDYFIQDNAYNSKSEFLRSFYKWQPYPYRFQNDWSFCYKNIYTSNLVLERLGLITRTADNATTWDHIKGSALFYKTYYNLELSWLFAKAYDETTSGSDKGIVLRNNTDFMQPSLRSTVEETYRQILQEGKEAARLLQNDPLYATRPSKCAAYAMIARAYLSMRKYDSAFRYADMALQIKDGLMNYNETALVAVNGANPFKIFNKEVVFHSTMSLSVPLYHPTTGPARIDTLLYATYNLNDLRRKAFFTSISGYQRFKGSYSGSASRLFSGIATDEIVLMRAECYARRGNTPAALNDLNSLLLQRFATGTYVPIHAATSAEALDFILLERRKELIFRGSLRWMDIKRLNKENRNIILNRLIAGSLFSLPPNDAKYALQIPEDVIETSGIAQN